MTGLIPMRHLAFIAAFAVAACAPVTNQPQITNDQARGEAERQLEASIKRLVMFQERGMSVFRPIITANVDLCGDKLRYTTGAGLISAAQLKPAQIPAYQKLFGLDAKLPTSLYVMRGSPAERAGVVARDIVERVNDTTSPSVQDFETAMKGGKSVRLTLRRGDAILTVEMVPERACDYPLNVVMQEVVNAYADGKKVIITSGMMKFTESDDELALILGHELAHNTMDHLGKKKGNEFVGVLLGATLGVLSGGLAGGNVMNSGAAAGRGAFSQEFEGEADYVGVYHAARAGYKVADAAALWRRMGEANPSSIHLEGTTHPSTAKRFLAIEAAAAEVEQKRAAGAPLVPDRREN